jgi:hypothetical protein
MSPRQTSIQLLLLVSVLGAFHGNPVDAQLPNCLTAHHRRELLQRESSILTRFSPLPIGSQSIPSPSIPSLSIPSHGANLAQVMLPGDLQAVAAAHIQSRLVRGSLPSDAYRHWLAKTDTPDTIAHFRGHQITVFPRVLLLHPQIAGLRIFPGDAIVTFSLGSSPDEIDDPIKTFFEKRLGFRESLRSGHVANITVVNWRRETSQLSLPIGQSLGNSVPWDYEAADAELAEDWSEDSREKREWESSLHSLTAVNILTRQVGGFHVRWIVPSKRYGRFSYNGNLFFRLLTDDYWTTEFNDLANDPRRSMRASIAEETKEKLIDQWNALLSRFSGISLTAGDRVELVAIELMAIEMGLPNLLQRF